MLTKQFIGGLAVLLNAGTSSVYLWQVFKHGLKPHAFSWVIWGTVGAVVFAAQYASNAGPGCWLMVMSAITCYTTAAVSLKYGEKHITRGDWACFIFSLFAIPAWVVTSNPLWAVVIVTAIDIVAFYPTFRKSWFKPHEEGAAVFAVYAFQMLLSIFALETYNMTNLLDPVIVFTLNSALAIMLVCRRRVLA